MELEELKRIAVKLRMDGLSYAKIGKVVGRTKSVVQRWLNPKQAKRDQQAHREWARKQYAFNPEKYRRQQREANKTLIGRCRRALTSARRRAKLNGYAPCTASPEELVEAFTGKCHFCGILESDCKQRLCMDHCHATGKFRGWLCDKHNTALGRIQDDYVAVLSYLCPQDAALLKQAKSLGGINNPDGMTQRDIDELESLLRVD